MAIYHFRQPRDEKAIKKSLSSRLGRAKAALSNFDKNNLQEKETLEKMHRANKITAGIFAILYVLITAFTLFFIGSRILYGGFYAGEGYHEIAIYVLLFSAVVLFAAMIYFFVAKRIHSTAGAQFVRWWLMLMALAIAIASFLIFRAWGYVIIAASLTVSTLIFGSIRLSRRRRSFKGNLKKNGRQKKIRVTLTVSGSVIVLLIILSLIVSFGFIPASEADTYVHMTAFSRSVRYVASSTDDGVMLEKVLLTVHDALGINNASEYEVLREVSINGEARLVNVIGREAFVGVRSVSSIKLADTVTVLKAGAFAKSSISSITVTSDNILIEDGLADSRVEKIYINEGVNATVIIGEGAKLKEGVEIIVCAEELDSYRINNPDLADRFSPLIDDGSVYVNFNVTAPDGSGEIASYVDSVIVKKDKDGFARVELPYAEYKTASDDYGTHWYYTDDNRIFRLLEMRVDGKKIDVSGESIVTDESLNVYCTWHEFYGLYFDYTDFGGDITLETEFYALSDYYTLPTGVRIESNPGYYCDSWYSNSSLSGSAVKTISNFNKNYILYPKWTLDAPEVEVSDFSGAYTGGVQSITAVADHVLDDVTFTYTWTKDRAVVSTSDTLDFKNVADSGRYTLSVMATDREGRVAVTTKEVQVSIDRAPLTVTAQNKTITYGDDALPLTYIYTGLLGDDTLTVELQCAQNGTVGTYPITFKNIDVCDNYSITENTSTYTIKKAQYDLSGLTFEDHEVVYDGNEHSIRIVGDLPIGLDGIPLTVTYYGSPKDVGDTSIYAIFSTNSPNYETPSAWYATMTITPMPITVTADDITTIYGVGADLTFTHTALAEGDSFSGELSRQVGDNVGEYAISIGTLTAGKNYEITFVGATYTINKATYDMSGITIADSEYVYDGDAHCALIGGILPTGLDGIQVQAIYDGFVTNVDDGTVITTVTFTSESGNYEDIELVLTANVWITPKEIFVSAEDKVITYGDANVPLTYQVIGLVGDDALDGELVRDGDDNVGVYAITQGSVTSSSNYTVIFTPATYVIEKADYDMSGITFIGQTFVYDGNAHSIVISGELPTGLDGITVTVSYTGSVTDVNDGVVTVTATFATESANYNVPGQMTAQISVTPKTVTVTADPASKIYGTADPEFTFSVDGLLGYDTVIGSLTRENGDNAGEYNILLGTVTASDNYSIEFIGATFVINKATYDMSGIGFNDQSFTYNGQEHNAFVSGTLPTGLDGITVTVKYEGFATYVTDGNVLTTATFHSESPNYEDIDLVLTAYTQITPRTLTIRAKDVSIIYGEADRTLEYVVIGLVGDDVLVGALEREAGDTVGQYTIYQGTLAANDNYNISYVSATYTIKKATYDMSGISLSDQQFIYDGEAHHAVISGTLPVGLDGISVVAVYTGEATQVYDGKVLTRVTFYSESENYETIDLVFTAWTEILPKVIDVVADSKEITYGDDNLTLTYTVSGLVEPDALFGELTREGGNNAGEYAILQGTLSANLNYSINYVGATYTINKATYDMSSISLPDRLGVIYDGQAHTAIIVGKLPVGRDGIPVIALYDGYATYVTDGEVYVTVTFTSESENYEEIDLVLNAYVSIAQRTLDITATDLSIVYGQENRPLTYYVSGLVDGDSLEGELVREQGDDAGVYAITQGTLRANENYAVSFFGGTYTIHKATYDMSGITISDAQFVYDGEAHCATVFGPIPVGRDGIPVVANYDGYATDVADGKVLTTVTFSSESDNYEAITLVLTAYVEIVAREIVVTADNVSITYGEEHVDLTYSSAGLIGSDELVGELTREEGENAGEYAIMQGTLTADGNYYVTFIPATYTINKAEYDMSGITFGGQNFIYDGSAHSVTVAGELPTGLDGSTLTVQYDGSATNVSEGKVKVVATFITDSVNYNVPEAMTAYVSIIPKGITVTADHKIATYGEDELELTYVVLGLVDGDSIFGELAREAGDDVGYYTINIGTLTAGDNYSIAFTEGIYYIGEASYDMSGISIQDQQFVYDGMEHCALFTGSLPVGLDGVEFTVTYEGYATSVSDGRVLTTITIVSNSTNYSPVEMTLTAYVEILPKALTVTANNVTVTYGDDDVPLTYVTDGLVEGDEISVELVREEGDDAGEYTITYSVLEVGDNYEVTFVDGTYTINKMKVNTPVILENVSYMDGNPVFCYAIKDSDPYTADGCEGYNKGMYVATFTLKDTDNYEWADESFDGTLVWYVVDSKYITRLD